MSGTKVLVRKRPVVRIETAGLSWGVWETSERMALVRREVSGRKACAGSWKQRA